jgi:pyridoxal phosphate enzyme (YggS family)
MSIAGNISAIKKEIGSTGVKFIAVSKTKPLESITEAYEAGQRIFGENTVQELVEKYEKLPKDIEWHLIGHLQTNKVKYIAPFISMIHSVDSMKLLKEINKQALKYDRIIDCLLQLEIADEDTKYGMDLSEAIELLRSEEYLELKKNILKLRNRLINKEVNDFYRFIIIQIQISKMSLFVGNVSKHVTMKEIENLFKKYGKCKIDLRVIL